MAKFATALCILLAVCGTQAGVMDMIYEHMQENMESIKAAIEEKKQEIVDAVDAIQKEYENKKQIIEEKTQAAIDEVKAKYEEVKANAEKAQSCISANIDIPASLRAIANNTIACSRNVVSEHEAKYQEVHAAFEELTDELGDILQQARECKNSNVSAISCLVKVWNNKASGAQEKWAALSEDSTYFAASPVGVSDKLQGCGISEYVSTATIEMQQAYAALLDCINNQNSVAY